LLSVMRFNRLAVLTALCAPVAAFTPNNRPKAAFPKQKSQKQQDQNKPALVGPLKVGEEVAEVARILDISSIFLSLGPAAALAAGTVALSKKNKLQKQVSDTAEQLETIKGQIKSTDAQITVRLGLYWRV